MANSKISALTSATTPLAGTETLPIVQSSTTKQVSVANLTAGRSVSMSAATISSGDLSFTSTAQKITGDFSNGTWANRVAFQTTTTNGATRLTVVPNGTGTVTALNLHANIDVANASVLNINMIDASEVQINSNKSGTGTYLPLAFYTNATKQLNIDTSGNVTVSTGNLIQGTAAKGINFTANTPASGMTSQLLNWYEEGTYTVTLYDAASGGNASATTVTGRYTRVGSLVTCSFSGLNGISTAGMTAGNTLYISLPFTASSTGIGTGSFACENIAFGGSRTNAIPVALNSNSRAIFRAYGSNTSSASLIVSNITSGSANIDYFTLTYRA